MSDIRKLERELAYSAARSDIEVYCVGMKHSGRYHDVWYDISGTAAETRCPKRAEYQPIIDRAVEYLEARKLLKHHPEIPALVQVLSDK